MSQAATELTEDRPRKRRATKKKKTAAKRRRKAPPAAALPQQPIHLPPFVSGQDYQVANPRLINGRVYAGGEILDRTGLDERHLRLLREQRIIIDIPLGAAPVLPIPNAEVVAPISPEEKKALTTPEIIVKGRVAPRHRGFGKWYAVDNNGAADGRNIGQPFEGPDARAIAQARCNEINVERGIEPTDEEVEIATADRGDK